MNRLVRALVGVVVAKAAVASAWYLYQKSTEQENDWKTEGQEDKQNQVQEDKNEVEPVEQSIPVEVKAKKSVRKTSTKLNQEAKPVVESEQVKPKRVRTPATKKVDTTTVAKEETAKPKRMRKSVAKNVEQTPKVEAKKSTSSRTKKA